MELTKNCFCNKNHRYYRNNLTVESNSSYPPSIIASSRSSDRSTNLRKVKTHSSSVAVRKRVIKIVCLNLFRSLQFRTGVVTGLTLKVGLPVSISPLARPSSAFPSHRCYHRPFSVCSFGIRWNRMPLTRSGRCTWKPEPSFVSSSELLSPLPCREGSSNLLMSSGFTNDVEDSSLNSQRCKSETHEKDDITHSKSSGAIADEPSIDFSAFAYDPKNASTTDNKTLKKDIVAVSRVNSNENVFSATDLGGKADGNGDKSDSNTEEKPIRRQSRRTNSASKQKGKKTLQKELSMIQEESLKVNDATAEKVISSSTTTKKKRGRSPRSTGNNSKTTKLKVIKKKSSSSSRKASGRNNENTAIDDASITNTSNSIPNILSGTIPAPSTPSSKDSNRKLTKTKSNSASSSSRRTPKIQPGSLPPPRNWKQTYTLVQELRSDRTAPVDTDGPHILAQKHLGPKVYRFQILVSLMLSSQTKDAVVGEAIRSLQSLDGHDGLTIPSLLQLSHESLNALINKVGFHNNKTKYILETVQILHNEYEDDIPPNAEELMRLPGVGPKMAYIIETLAWGTSTGIGIDTHMHRLFQQLRWVDPDKCTTPEKTREYLEGWLPIELWNEVNYLWVGFGQECQQQKEKMIKKALVCSRPMEALGLLKRVGLDYVKEGKRFGLDEEIRQVLNGSVKVEKK